ncbi:hypothetical protein DITRI_Ditri16bG0115900 [Diplodiscus trichospermus]
MASTPITHPLPEGIVVDILARLPVKSLKRFRCVGKSWCSLIQSPQFISAHYSFNKNKAYPVVKYGKTLHIDEEKNAISIISNQTFDIVANLDMPPFTDDDISVCIRGYCNGIICLWSYDGTVLLWNIATKEYKTLPVCPFESPPDFNNSAALVCMGYDSKRDDYKVIRIDTFWNDDFEYEDPRAMHAASVENEKVLLSFDMSSEVFVITPLPDGTNDSIFHFMEINGSVGGICHDLWNPDKCYDVWVLVQFGQKNSWIKLFTIGPVLKAKRLLAVGSDG